MFRKITKKEIYRMRRDLFTKDVVPILESHGFVKAPFKTSDFGCTNDTRCFDYELGRLRNDNILEIIDVYICNPDRFIHITINVVKLTTEVQSMSEVQKLDGIKYGIPPYNYTELNIDYYFLFEKKPFFSTDFRFKDLKLGCFFTEYGYKRQVRRLRELLIEKMNNIEYYFDKWYVKYGSTLTRRIDEPDDDAEK